MRENRCICCGSIIPEGQQVCPLCQKKAEEKMQKAQRSFETDSKFATVMEDWVIPIGFAVLLIWVLIKISSM